MSIEAILFDIDGTLVDSNEQHVEAWVIAFEEAGSPQAAHVIRGQIGKGGDILVPTLLPNADAETCERIAARQGAVFKERYLDGVRAFDGAAALIRAVDASGRRVVLASSAKQDDLDHYVDLLGIRDVLHATSSSDDVNTSKPAPDIFVTALDRAGAPASAALAIGDTPYDVEAAAKAGIAAIGVTSGPFDRAILEKAGAIAVYRNVAELLIEFDRSPIVR